MSIRSYFLRVVKKNCAINSDIEDELGRWFSNAKRVVIAGIGSPLRKDDFVGVEIVRNLRGKVPRSVCLMECGTIPENFLEPIAGFDPTHVLIVDAALLDREPGSSKLIKPDEIAGLAISTHALPLSLFCEYLAKTTGAKIGLLAVQPKDTGFGKGLSDELNESAKRLSSLLSEILSSKYRGDSKFSRA